MDYYMKQYNLGHERLHAILCNDKPRQLRIEAEIKALEDERRNDNILPTDDLNKS